MASSKAMSLLWYWVAVTALFSLSLVYAADKDVKVISHVTILTIGTTGDVNPYVALCKKIQDTYNVICRIATHEKHKEIVESRDLEYRPLAGAPTDLMEWCVKYGMYSLQMMVKAGKKHKEFTEELLADAHNAVEGTDLIIEAAQTMVGRYVAEVRRIPFLRVMPFPWTESPAFPHPFATEWPFAKTFKYWDLIDFYNSMGLLVPVSKYRVYHGHSALPAYPPPAYPDNSPFIYSFSESLVSKEEGWPGKKHVYVSGYWFLPPSTKPPEPQAKAAVDYIVSRSKKKVYIGFGSITVQNPEVVVNNIVEGVSKAKVAAVLSLGWAAVDGVDLVDFAMKAAKRYKIEDNFRAYAGNYPHDLLFPQMDGVVHHGGAGTVAAGLKAAKPTMVVPFALDQPFWAQRVEDKRFGVYFKRADLEKADGSAGGLFGEALTRLLNTKEFAANAQKVSEKLKKEDGLTKAVEIISQELQTNYKGLLIHNKLRSDGSAYADRVLLESELKSLKRHPPPGHNQPDISVGSAMGRIYNKAVNLAFEARGKSFEGKNDAPIKAVALFIRHIRYTVGVQGRITYPPIEIQTSSIRPQKSTSYWNVLARNDYFYAIRKDAKKVATMIKFDVQADRDNYFQKFA